MFESEKSQIEEFFKGQDKHAKVRVSFHETYPGHKCSIHLEVSGHGLGGLASFKNLMWLSKVLGTEDIDIEDEYQRGGCETCDWGSATEATIECRNIECCEPKS